MSKASFEQAYWAFSYRPLRNSPDGELVEFLNSLPKKEAKEIAIQAIRAYWRVAAAMAKGDKSDEEMRLLGLHCCNTLESHSDYLRAMLLLPPRVTHTIVPSNSYSMNPAIEPSSPVSSEINEAKEDFKRDDTKKHLSLAEIDSDLLNFD